MKKVTLHIDEMGTVVVTDGQEHAYGYDGEFSYDGYAILLNRKEALAFCEAHGFEVVEEIEAAF